MQHIAVVGAGTMGNGIAHVFAMHGYEVTLIDLSEKQLTHALATISKNLDRMVQKGRISSQDKVSALINIHAASKISSGVAQADLVVEAVSESEPIKRKVFEDLDKYAPPASILATNTSSISITKLAAIVKEPARVIGMHFMNPVPIMKLVEIINGYETDPAVTEAVLQLTEQIGKVPVVVNDYPGFVANRILMPMINEAIFAVFEGVATVRAVDQIMKLGMAHPMGPLQLADFIGLDICLSILDVLHEGFGQSKYAPCPLLVKMVHAGNLGKKTGIGFYDYREGGKGQLKVSPQFR